MAAYTIFKLKNLTPFHIGTGKENYDFSSAELHSDTLSAALTALWVQKGNRDGVREFMSSFTISSAFPFAGNRYFLPKMQGKLQVEVDGCEESEVRKRLKQVRFIESSLWQKMASGEKFSIVESQLKGSFLIAGGERFNPPFKSEVMQRLSVPREDNQDADPFFFNWTFTDSQCGLYCFVDADEKVIQELNLLFEQLGETGIGTDKNVGGGKFEVEQLSMKLEFQSKGNSLALLSFYIPTEGEFQFLKLEQAKYELVKRGGYIGGSEMEEFRHLRKKSVHMFAVGSVFPTTEKLQGKIVDLRPDWNDDRLHPVYRSGKPFYVHINDNVL